MQDIFNKLADITRPETALWRRVSTDSHYIISEKCGLVFIEGTQSEDKIDKLLSYIATTSEFIGRWKHRDISELKIVKNSAEMFNSIENKHIFTNLHK